MFRNFNFTQLFKPLVQSSLVLHDIRAGASLYQIKCELYRLVHLFDQGIHFFFCAVNFLESRHPCHLEGLNRASLSLSDLCDHFFGCLRDFTFSGCDIYFQVTNRILKLSNHLTLLACLSFYHINTRHNVIFLVMSGFVKQNDLMVSVICDDTNMTHTRLARKTKEPCYLFLVELLRAKGLSLQ